MPAKKEIRVNFFYADQEIFNRAKKLGKPPKKLGKPAFTTEGELIHCADAFYAKYGFVLNIPNSTVNSINNNFILTSGKNGIKPRVYSELIVDHHFNEAEKLIKQGKIDEGNKLMDTGIMIVRGLKADLFLIRLSIDILKDQKKILLLPERLDICFCEFDRQFEMSSETILGMTLPKDIFDIGSYFIKDFHKFVIIDITKATRLTLAHELAHAVAMMVDIGFSKNSRDANSIMNYKNLKRYDYKSLKLESHKESERACKERMATSIYVI